MEIDPEPQSPRDKVLWELANHGRAMTRSRLRRQVKMPLAELEPILEELEREGVIEISDLMRQRSNQLITLQRR